MPFTSALHLKPRITNYYFRTANVSSRLLTLELPIQDTPTSAQEASPPSSPPSPPSVRSPSPWMPDTHPSSSTNEGSTPNRSVAPRNSITECWRQDMEQTTAAITGSSRTGELLPFNEPNLNTTKYIYICATQCLYESTRPDLRYIPITNIM